jgi:hypothetical protein
VLLVVDDEADSLRALTGAGVALRRHYRILASGSARDALAILTELRAEGRRTCR